MFGQTRDGVTKCVVCGRRLRSDELYAVLIAAGSVGGISVTACEKHAALARTAVDAAKEAGLKLWEWRGPKVVRWFGQLRDRIRGAT